MRVRLAHAQGFLGIRHGVAMLAQAQAGETTAVVGVAHRGIEPDRRLEVVQRQPGASETMYSQPRRLKSAARSARRAIAFVTSSIAPGKSLSSVAGQPAQLVNRGRRLAAGDERVARSDDIVVTLQLEQQIEPQAVGSS